MKTLKLYFVLLLILFSSLVVKSQSYYELINIGDSLTFQHSLQEANGYFAKAYALAKDKMMPRHLMNWYVNSVELEDEPTQNKVLRLLKIKGWSQDNFQNYAQKYYPKQAKNMMAMYESIPYTYKADEKTIALNSLLDSLMQIDQFIRHQYDVGHINDSLTDGLILIGKIDVHLIGILGELADAGYFDFSDLVYFDFHPQRGNSSFWVINIHARQSHQYGIDYSPFYRLYQQQKMYPETFESLMSIALMPEPLIANYTIEDQTIEYPLFPYNLMAFEDSTQVKDSLFIITNTEIDTAICKKQRSKIPGLKSLSQSLQSKVFAFYNPQYAYQNRVFFIPAQVKHVMQMVYGLEYLSKP